MLSARAACVGARRANLFCVLSWLPCVLLFSGLPRVLGTLLLEGAAPQMYNLPSGSCGGRVPECMCGGGSGPCLKQGLKHAARQGLHHTARRGLKHTAWQCLRRRVQGFSRQPGDALSSRPGGALRVPCSLAWLKLGARRGLQHSAWWCFNPDSPAAHSPAGL